MNYVYIFARAIHQSADNPSDQVYANAAGLVMLLIQITTHNFYSILNLGIRRDYLIIYGIVSALAYVIILSRFFHARANQYNAQYDGLSKEKRRKIKYGVGALMILYLALSWVLFVQQYSHRMLCLRSLYVRTHCAGTNTF